MQKTAFTMREVKEDDLPELAALERQLWGGLGTPIWAYADLKEWLEKGSPFFLLAESGGRIGGYYYGQLNDFSLEKTDDYTKFDTVTGRGYTRHEHDPNGNSVYGVCVSSIMRGAGAALHAEVHLRIGKLRKKYFFCHSRIPGFAAYLAQLDPESRKYAEGRLDQVALWYAHGCMKLAGARDWGPWCTLRPTLALPEPIPDPVLTSHVKGIGTCLGLLRVVSGFMNDPESKHYSAFCACDRQI